MSARSAERKAQNEGAFREANERLERGARELVGADETSLVPFLCECPREECAEIVLLALTEYEGVRARGEQGVAAVGHEDVTIERVVARNDRFIVAEKIGSAGDVHRQTDPRGVD